jgi:biopolymer transport protein ExbD
LGEHREREERARRERSRQEAGGRERLTVLLEEDQILVQQFPTGDARKLPAFDWTRLESALREFKTPGETPTVEVAAASTNAHPIEYQQLIVAMDTAVRAGYPRVGVTDPMTLAR